MSIQIYQNVLKFLERVQTTGLEAYAFCEAHAFLTQQMQALAKTTAQAQLAKEEKKDVPSA